MADYPAHGLPNWDDELKTYIDAVAASQAEQAMEDYIPGTEAAYAAVSSAISNTASAYPGATLPGLSLAVLGNGRPVDIEAYFPSVTHSVADLTLTVLILRDGNALDANGGVGGLYLPVANKGGGFTVSRRVIIPNGVTWTFTLASYPDKAGTTSFVAAAYCPIEFRATRR